MSWLLSLVMVVALFGLVVAVACMLAPCGARRTVCALVLLGLLVSGLKILVIQQAPQWHDINPDSITYDLNARAFTAHWAGHSVEGVNYNLRGLLAFNAAGLHSSEWHPTELVTYAGVVGSHEWFYTAYVAIWYWLNNATQGFVIASNALWAAFFPAAAFGIAITLGANRRVALAAGGLALVDPSAGVNASWLLKDTFAGFFTMAALWALLGYVQEGKRIRLLIAVLALGSLGGVRFVAFLGLIIATGIMCIWFLLQKQRTKVFALAGVLSCSWLLQGVHVQAPHFIPISNGYSLASSALSTPVRVFFGGVRVLNASEGDRATDGSVLSWKRALSDEPVFAIVRSLMRTLFAPYPWVAISPGLNWRSSSELYYPGVLLLVACLPGVITALVFGLRGRDPVFWLLILFLASQFAAYTIWLGEWSTRQRVFVLPALFALAALGWMQLRAFVRHMQTVRFANSNVHQS